MIFFISDSRYLLETIILFIVTWCTTRASSKDVCIRNCYQFLAIIPVFISYNIGIKSFYSTNPREAEYIACFVARLSILVIWPSGNEQVDREIYTSCGKSSINWKTNDKLSRQAVNFISFFWSFCTIYYFK